MQMYQVGGAVRDELLGIRSKDIDFSVVLDKELQVQDTWRDPFGTMVKGLKRQGFTIHVEHPEFLTVRGRFPKTDILYPGRDADFVLARKEGTYSDGRRPDVVEPGSLYDDLARRDFTMNAIAKMGAVIIDPHFGAQDIKRRIIRAVGDPLERLTEDPLRALRAIRFAVTKGFNIDPNLRAAMAEPSVAEGISLNVSDERIAEEFSKMFRKDTIVSIILLNDFPALMQAAFSGLVSLDATMKQKGRG